MSPAKLVTIAMCCFLSFCSTASVGSNSVARKLGSNWFLFGPSIFLCCTKVDLYSPHTGNVIISVSKSGENFEAVILWIANQFISKLNWWPPEPTGDIPAYSLALYSDAAEGLGKLVIAIPLNAETLGSDYKKKTQELQEIMINAKSKP